MPRKTSQAVKKDTAVDSKNEGGAPRRSGRATTKQETSSGKEATRSRRSSTAAQTAASVADSKTPKGRTSVGSRRDSTSPSDSRGKNSREGVESPATRVKSTRRNTGRINYKESDGEEEGTTPKYDDNFDSGEEFEESDSDEKSKPRGRNKPPKTVTKSRGAKDKGKASARSRRGRPIKKKSNDDEDSEALEVSDDSADVDSTPTNKKSKATPNKEKEPVKVARGRKSKAEVKTEVSGSKGKSVSEDKTKPARRSARSVSNKEESPKKRPSRSLQAKRYTEEEEEDEDIEEASESKNEEEEEEYVKPSEGSRKRKRGSTSEPNKRVKETVENEHEEANEEIESKEDKEDVSESKPEVKKDKETVEDEEEEEEEEEEEKEEKLQEEPMEVDESDSAVISETDSKSAEVKSEEKELKSEDIAANEENVEDKEKPENSLFSSAKEKLSASNKQESIDSSENLDESNHSSDSEQGSRAEQSLSSGLEDSQDSKENKKEDAIVPEKSGVADIKQQEVDITSQSSESFQQIDDNSEESKGLQPTAVCSEQKDENKDKTESNVDFKSRGSSESYKNENSAVPQESKTSGSEISPAIASFQVGSSVPPAAVHSNEQVPDASLNGSEKSSVSNPAPVIHSTSNVIFEQPEDSAPKANGAHDDLHSNSVSPNDQYYSVPGRKYIVNTKLNENIRQSVQDKTFGFVSYNLDSSNSEACLQKDKLLNELNNLNAHIICIQQISKGFYSGILEPSLDALGFKGTFTQPEESLKGMATFYKTSFFRLSGRSEASLKLLIEKELEASPLDPSDRLAVRAHVKRCGHVLFTHFASIIGTHSITVANVQVPPADLSIHALQVSCLVREAVRINGGTNKPILLGGEFNMAESDVPYKLLRDGYLSNDMMEELQRRKDVALPGKENAALANLLWKSFQLPSSNLCSCYTSVLDHEIFIPEQKITSPDLLWYSSDSLYTVGVLDIVSDKPGDHHFSLKADIAFSV